MISFYIYFSYSCSDLMAEMKEIKLTVCEFCLFCSKGFLYQKHMFYCQPICDMSNGDVVRCLITSCSISICQRKQFQNQKEVFVNVDACLKKEKNLLISSEVALKICVPHVTSGVLLPHDYCTLIN